MNAYAKYTKQQLLDLVAELQAAQPQTPTVLGPVDNDPTLWDTPTFPNTPDDIPATIIVETPVIASPPRPIRSFQVLINGKLKHTITIPNDEPEALRRALFIAKQAGLKGWPNTVRSVIL